MVTKQDIKNAAFALFAGKGYAETSMDHIAKALGLKKQSLYSHFQSKAEIFNEIIQDQSIYMVNELGRKMRELANQPAETLLKGIFECYITIFSHRDRLLLLKRIILMVGTAEYVMVNGMYAQFSEAFSIDLFETIKKRYLGLDQNNFSRFFLSYMLTIFGYLEWMLMSNAGDPPFDAVWSNFWNGAARLLQTDGEDLDTLHQQVTE